MMSLLKMRNTINPSSHQLLTSAGGRYFVQNLGMYQLRGLYLIGPFMVVRHYLKTALTFDL